MELISRDDAKSEGLSRYFTGVRCKHGHLSARYTSSTACVACNKASLKKSRVKHPIKWSAETAAYKKKWDEDSKSKFLAYERLRCQGVRSCSLVARRTKKSGRKPVPNWISSEQIEQMNLIYQTARDCTIIGGAPYEVDHIIPLQNDKVCGLHVPWNLQVLPQSMNRFKKNKMEIYHD